MSKGEDPRGDNAGVSNVSDHDEAGQLQHSRGLRRRRNAARRLQVLECGCGDPWHSGPPPTSPRSLMAARDTWRHLEDLGYLPADSAGQEWLRGVLGVAS